MYILDTSFIINYFKKKKKNIDILTKAINDPGSKIFITSITVYELIGGAYFSNNFEKHYNLYKELRKFVEVLDLDEESSITAGRIYTQLRKKGKIIEDTDILIASICIENNCTLLTENLKHFVRIKDLKIVR